MCEDKYCLFVEIVGVVFPKMSAQFKARVLKEARSARENRIARETKYLLKNPHRPRMELRTLPLFAIHFKSQLASSTSGAFAFLNLGSSSRLLLLAAKKAKRRFALYLGEAFSFFDNRMEGNATQGCLIGALFIATWQVVFMFVYRHVELFKFHR